MLPTTCITRRDIQRQFSPTGSRGVPVAVEVVPYYALDGSVVGKGASERDVNGRFLREMLGSENLFAFETGREFSFAIADRYKLDGRSTRAFWINPGCVPDLFPFWALPPHDLSDPLRGHDACFWRRRCLLRCTQHLSLADSQNSS